MPGSMIHLLMAHKINPDSSTLFYIGNLAPDAVIAWKEKDITHFRNLSDRSKALAELAARTPPDDDFAEGILLHLYTDWRWDTLARDEFIKTAGDGWFPQYRHELSLASIFAFHQTDWAVDVLDRIYQCDKSEYGEIPGATADDLRDFISHVYEWYTETETEASSVFTPEFVERFIDEIAPEYLRWRNDNPCISVSRE